MHQSNQSRTTDDGPLGEKASRSLDARPFRTFLVHPPKVAVFTSPITSEPKNRTCAALGLALAREGKNTLVLDCDFRKPSLHEFFGLPNASGLHQVLLGERELREVWTEPVPGLKLVSAGLPRSPTSEAPSTSNRHSSKLLRTRSLSKCLASVQEGFDCVLVNTPPIRTSPEPLGLATIGYPILLVFVAQAATRARGAVAQSIRRLVDVGADVRLAPVPSESDVRLPLGLPRYRREGRGGQARARIEATEKKEDTEQQSPTSSQKPYRAGGFFTSFLQFLLMMLVGIALLFGLIKPYLLDAFYVPTSSMVPTLEVNDRVLVNKLAYRFGEPKRGDIIVFEAPDGTAHLIKRVEGVAGDSIAVEHGTLIVNGERQEEPYLNPELPDESTYGPITVPEGSVFAMGDNRADSEDSRFIGPIPEKYVVGKAFVRVWPLNRMGVL